MRVPRSPFAANQSPVTNGRSTPEKRDQRHSYRYENGSELVVGGLDDMEKHRSSEYDWVYVQECSEATEDDWRTEYLAPILSIRVVDGLDQAIAHIEQYGSHHTDSIITEDYTRARRFLREVESASVMVNASTQFADGGEYGLGAEIGISTDKLHARGPVGVEGLTTQKYVVLGDGSTRA